jgi:signal transduction histidine kinase
MMAAARRSHQRRNAKRGLWRPENRRVRTKLTIIMTLPLVALLALSIRVMVATTRDATEARRLVDLATVSAESGRLASRLSVERAAATLAVVQSPDSGAKARMDAAIRATDDVLGAWKAARSTLQGRELGAADQLSRVDELLAAFPDVREQVRSDAEVALSVVAFRYRLVIVALLDVRQTLIVSGVPTQLADRARAAAGLSQASESLGLLQVDVVRATEAGRMTPAAAAQIAAARAGYAEGLLVWGSGPDPVWHEWLDRALTGEKIRAAQRLDGLVSRTGAGESLAVNAAEWVAVQQERQLLIDGVGAKADATVVSQLDAYGDERVTIALVTGASAAGVLLVGLWLAWFMARRMIRSLRELREGAVSMAERGLPEAVARLAQRPDLATLNFEQALRESAVALPVVGADEVADVTAAFNQVQQRALSLALEQAQSGKRVAAMFVALGWRQQQLVVRLMGALDTLERHEDDPDRLAELFKVDHLATRMRRANANLLLLGGVTTTVAAEPLGLFDTIRAALSSVLAYERVDVGIIDVDVVVAAEAVEHVVQALTELIDNACEFSPPHTRVRISAERVGDRVIVLIDDEGIGATTELLAPVNAMLASGGELSVPTLRTMGLAVVARVAALHGLSARLSSREHVRGITAELVLPAAVLQLPRRQPQLSTPVLPRLMDRREGVPQPAWSEPPPAGGEVTGTGLPIRPAREAEGTLQPVSSAVPRRDPAARNRALSNIQMGTRAARNARGH